MGERPRRPVILLAIGLAAVVLAACGTTVPQTTNLSSGSATNSATGLDPASGSPTAIAAGPTAHAVAGSSDPTGAPITSAIAGTSLPGVTSSSGTAVSATTGPGVPGQKPGTSVTESGRATARPSASATATGVKGSNSTKAAGATPAAGQGPLAIGFAYQDNATADAALGSGVNTSLNRKTAADAIVKAIDASGGFDGRQVTLDEYEFNTDDSDYSTDAAAACQKFTQDDPVPIVIDLAFGVTGGFAQCLQKAGIADIGANETDDATAASLALTVSTFEMSLNRTYASVLNGELKTGYLTSSNKIGILLEDCSDTTAAYNDTIMPLVKQLKLDVAYTAHFQCTTGFASARPAASTVSNAVLEFQTNQVDRVMIMSYYEDIGLLLFSQSAQSQQYHPGYMLSSNAEAAPLKADDASGQLAQFHGIGHIPTFDTENSAFPLDPVEAQCEQLLTAGMQTDPKYDDHLYAYLTCGPMLLIKDALVADGGNASGAAIINAITSLGSFADPGVVGAASSFSASQHNGPDEVQAFGYDSGCSCLSYSGSPFAAS